MSERQAMEICANDGCIEGCDEHLSDACLSLVEALVRLAAGVIAGAKPAAIFNLTMRTYCGGKWRELRRGSLDEALRTYVRALAKWGVSLTVLYRTDQRVYLLAWRPELVQCAVSDPEAMALLRKCGYAGERPSELLCELRRRLASYYLSSGGGREQERFPHEIGVFLGYPVEDVRGFMEGGRPTCKGPWHAFGDEQLARRRFRALEAQESRCRSRYAQGEPLRALLAPCA